MDESLACALCGDEIDVGQAWMEADREGAHIRAHAGCVYRDEAGGAEEVAWEPQESTRLAEMRAISPAAESGRQ